MAAGQTFGNGLLEAKAIEAACQQLDLAPALVFDLLRIRRDSERDGNRRRLFAGFASRLMATAPFDYGVEMSPEEAGGEVSLRRLTLRNWKVFDHVDLIFPPHNSDKPVILVGGKNGFGKTSLLEGLLYCLFGRAAFTERSRLAADSTSLASRALAYQQFIERVIHVPAVERGDTMASARSEWSTPSGPICIERRWYLDKDGHMDEDDESIVIQVGEDQELLGVPEDAAPSSYYQSFIERKLMSAGAAAFLLFDGEQVRRFSEKGLADQVRLVTQSAFGLSGLLELAEDLLDFGRDRSRRADKEDGVYEQYASHAAAAAQTLTRLLEERDRLASERAMIATTRDQLLDQLAKLANATYADLRDVLERRHVNDMELARDIHDQTALASSALPFLLCGATLRRRVLKALERDTIADARDTAAFKSEDALALLVNRLHDRVPPVDSALIEQVQLAWHELGKDDRASTEALRHAYLKPHLRQSVIERLKRAPARAEDFRIACDRVRDRLEEQSRLADLARQAQDRENQTTEQRQRLGQSNTRIAQLDERLEVLADQIAAAESELNATRARREESGTVDGLDRNRQGLVDLAMTTAEKIEQLAYSLRANCFETVAKAVSSTFAKLAHKGLVTSVAISPEGEVRLFDGRNRDVAALEASAGETQIFAMALLAAIHDILPTRVPIIMDTPLGRLDGDHRERLLSYFASRSGQTLMLSQPEEINGVYLALIADRVGGRFLLSHSVSPDGPGVSTAREGYFDEVAA